MKYLKYLFITFITITCIGFLYTNYLMLRWILESGNPFWHSFNLVFLNTPSITWYVLTLFVILMFKYSWLPLLLAIPLLLKEVHIIVSYGVISNFGISNSITNIFMILAFIAGFLYFGILAYKKINGQPPKQ